MRKVCPLAIALMILINGCAYRQISVVHGIPAQASLEKYKNQIRELEAIMPKDSDISTSAIDPITMGLLLNGIKEVVAGVMSQLDQQPKSDIETYETKWKEWSVLDLSIMYKSRTIALEATQDKQYKLIIDRKYLWEKDKCPDTNTSVKNAEQ